MASSRSELLRQAARCTKQLSCLTDTQSYLAAGGVVQEYIRNDKSSQRQSNFCSDTDGICAQQLTELQGASSWETAI